MPTAPTRGELLAACGPLAPLFERGLRPHPEGWRLGCHPEDMIDSDARLLGDHGEVWSASECPALLLHTGPVIVSAGRPRSRPPCVGRPRARPRRGTRR
ncbi:hypothetical protein [Streptomyces sp. NPDC002490]|uniref:hypothetical protein n=1 Tax=Streptomyces sp. NPDC002490 TaxID=3154416 RepID=UPI00331B9C98